MHAGIDPLDHESKDKKKGLKAIPEGKKKELKGKIFFCIILVLIVVAVSAVDYCVKVVDKTAEIVQQTKDDGKTVEIDGKPWKKVTFYDEYDRCWKIYSSADNTKGKSVFAVACPKEK